VASHELIDGYLADLSRRLPAEIIDELADGITETWQHHLAAGSTPAEAARLAVAEFGTPDQVNLAFAAQQPGRRIARLLLATGPLVGACWGASLITADVWTWPIPPAAAISFGLSLLAVVVTLLASATSRDNYRRARLGSFGAFALVALDALMLIAVLLLAPALVWPMAVAIPISLARIVTILRTLPVLRFS
jgi:hypothetical protein